MYFQVKNILNRHSYYNSKQIKNRVRSITYFIFNYTLFFVSFLTIYIIY